MRDRQKAAGEKVLIHEGDVVRFERDMEISNSTLPTQGLVGTVTWISHVEGNPRFHINQVGVRLDRHFRELDEWNNELIFAEPEQIQSLLNDLTMIRLNPDRQDSFEHPKGWRPRGRRCPTCGR